MNFRAVKLMVSGVEVGVGDLDVGLMEDDRAGGEFVIASNPMGTFSFKCEVPFGGEAYQDLIHQLFGRKRAGFRRRTIEQPTMRVIGVDDFYPLFAVMMNGKDGTTRHVFSSIERTEDRSYVMVGWARRDLGWEPVEAGEDFTSTRARARQDHFAEFGESIEQGMADWWDRLFFPQFHHFYAGG